MVKEKTMIYFEGINNKKKEFKKLGKAIEGNIQLGLLRATFEKFF